MAEEFEIEAIKEWKQKVETEFTEINNIINQKKSRLELLQIMIDVVSQATRDYSSTESIQADYWEKYGQPLEQESKVLIEETTTNSELHMKRRELQCLLNRIDRSLSQITR